jgi:hypothetical protein
VCVNESSLLVVAKSKWTDEVHQAALVLTENPQFYQYLVEHATFSDANVNLLDRLPMMKPGSYVTSRQEAIICRMKTVGIIELECRYKGTTWRVFDVGGARNERQKVCCHRFH